MQKRLFFISTIISIALIFISGCTKEKKVVEVRYAPVLYNLSAPDSLQKGSPEIAYLFIDAFDPDGLDDIDSVYFMVTKPDNSSNFSHYYLHDDGQFGDSTMHDGRFTLGITAPSDTNQSGGYTFTFYAKDREGNNSNHPQKIIIAF